jgi:hypothetical protein
MPDPVTIASGISAVKTTFCGYNSAGPYMYNRIAPKRECPPA